MWILMPAITVVLGGCYRPLFDEKLPPNQFSQHDEARGGAVAMETTDAFGTPQPALRNRLLAE